MEPTQETYQAALDRVIRERVTRILYAVITVAASGAVAAGLMFVVTLSGRPSPHALSVAPAPIYIEVPAKMVPFPSICPNCKTSHWAYPPGTGSTGQVGAVKK